MDRGMVSEATLTWFREGGRRYLVGGLPKSELKKHAAELAGTKGWEEVRDGVAVRYAQVVPDEAGVEKDLILSCRSDDRREKETAMQDLFVKRIEEALIKLQRRCQKAKKPLSLEKIQRQVGRLLQRNQREDRTQAHIFVCFLAFVLWKLLEQWQSRAGLGNSPRTILEELGHIQSGDIVLPTVTGEKIRLRTIASPEAAQKIILQHLGLDLPRRMRVPEHLVAKM